MCDQLKAEALKSCSSCHHNPPHSAPVPCSPRAALSNAGRGSQHTWSAEPISSGPWSWSSRLSVDQQCLSVPCKQEHSRSRALRRALGSRAGQVHLHESWGQRGCPSGISCVPGAVSEAGGWGSVTVCRASSCKHCLFDTSEKGDGRGRQPAGSPGSH